MKWVGIILGGLVGLVVVAVLVLLVLGKRSSAGKGSTAVVIDRSPDTVFPWLREPDKLMQWVSWLVEVRRDSVPDRIGAKQVWVMDDPNMKKKVELANEVTVLEPNQRLAVRLSSPLGFKGNMTYTLTDLGGGRTELRVDSQFTFEQWFAALMEPLVMPQARKKIRGDLAQLKSRVESGT